MKKSVALFVILYFIAAASSTVKANKPLSTNGLLDLTSWNFDKDGSIPLDGKWEFYWNKLYSPSDFENDSIKPKPTGFIETPGYWNWQNLNGTSFPSFGYATYRLRIKTSNVTQLLGLKILDMSSSYKLWVNDDLIASNGFVSTIPSKAVPQYLPMVKPLQKFGDDVVITIQVSNFFHYKAGLWESIYLGKYENLINKRSGSLYYDLFFIGALFILFIYHFFIFFMRRKQFAAFWFGLSCLFIAMRVLLINERFFYVLFPDFNLNIGLRLEYLSILSLIPFCFLMFLLYLLRRIDRSKIIIRIATFVFSTITLIIIFSPTKIYTSLILYFQIILLATATYCFILSILALKDKTRSAVISFLSLLIFYSCIINDLLYSDLIINTMYLAPYMFIIFLIVQAYLLADNISKSFSKIENLSSEVLRANQTLEQKVEERTLQLQETQKELIKKEKLAVIGKVASTMAHEIQNPLNFVNNFADLSHSLIEDFLSAKTEEEKIELIEILKTNLDKINHHGKRADEIIKKLQQHLLEGKGEEFFKS